MGRCKYCDAEVTEGSIRCDKCDKVWQDGAKFGRADISSRLKETLRALLNLSEWEAK